MQMHCKRCQAKIPTENTNQAQHIVTCPECGAVLPLDSSDAKAVSSPRWSNTRMPRGLTVEPSEDELKITRRWFSGRYIFIGIFALVWNGFMVSLVGGFGWAALFFPHVWVGIGLAYYVLAGFLNSSEITVNPNRLRIKHSPIPAWGNKKFDPIILRQLYSKERKHRHKNSVSYTYEVHMLTWDGRNQPLLKKLDAPQQALFIEQEIERFLHIEDEHVAGELSDPAVNQKGVKWESWQTFSKTNKLTFNAGKLLESFGVYGNYQGYNFRLSAFRKHQNGPPYTQFVITRVNGSLQKSEPRQLMREEIIKTLNPTHSKFSLQEKFRVREYGQEISYEQGNIPTNIEYLQFVLDSLYNLIDAYPKIVALGGEAVPTLQPIAGDKDHPLRSIASQLIQDIAPTTLRLRDHASYLICKRCLAHSGPHEAESSWFSIIIYYGCRICHQSNDFYLSKSVIAVLDSQMDTEPLQQGDELRVNWLARRELFDFDVVEIVQATDEDVERFAVQVGNDTDPARQPHYKTMPCVVAAGCGLSKNTTRILQHTFGLMEVS